MDFQKEVIEKSKEQPVVVDFWAPWCGPCQALGPVIEEIANEGEGKWQLVKVNTDEYPDLMQRYQIKGIPAVKMFHKGEVVAEFGGALPKFQIEKWLEKHLPTKEKEAFAAIEEQLAQDSSQLELLHDFITRYPEFGEAKLLLAKHTLFQEPSKAKELMEGIKPGHPSYYKVEPLKQTTRVDDLGDAGRSCGSADSSASQKCGEPRQLRYNARAVDHGCHEG